MMLQLQVRLHAAEKKQQEVKELRQLVRQLKVKLYVAEAKQQQTLEDMNHLKSVQAQEIVRLREDERLLKIAHEKELARANARNEKLLAEAIEMGCSAGRKNIPHTSDGDIFRTSADGDTGSSSDPVAMMQMLQEEESDTFSDGGVSASMTSPKVQKQMMEDPTIGSQEPEAAKSPRSLHGAPSLVQAQLSPVVGSSLTPIPSESDTSEPRRGIKDEDELFVGFEDDSTTEKNGASASSTAPGTGSNDDLPSGDMLDKISLELSDVSKQSQAKDLLSEYFGMRFDTLHHAMQHLDDCALSEFRLKALYHKFTRHFNLPGQLIVPSLRLCQEGPKSAWP